jgi:dolichyl-phosphate beta-glucosyltransferase
MSYEKFTQWRNQHIEQPVLSVIVPTYNEAIRILPTLGSIAVVVSGIQESWELIVSDDGSTDTTASLVDELGWANLRVIRHGNTGKGGAVKRGILASKGQVVLFTDADNSTPIEELPHFLNALKDAEVVIGSRGAQGAQEQHKSSIRRLASWVMRGLTKRLLGLPIRDTQCGFKLLERQAALQLCAMQRMEGFSFDLEWLYLARKCGYRVTELPVGWFDAPGSKVNGLRDGIKFIRDMVKILHNDLIGNHYPTEVNHASGYRHRLATKSRHTQ